MTEPRCLTAWDKLVGVHEVDVCVKPSSNGSTVKVDGVNVESLKSFTVEHVAGSPPKVTLEILIPKILNISGEAPVEAIFYAFGPDGERIELIPKP